MTPRLARRALVAGSALLLAASLTPAIAASRPAPLPACADRHQGALRIDVPVGREKAKGLVAYPDGKPRGLVVFFHGYGHTMESWRVHIARVAKQERVVAVAMNYRRQQDSPPKTKGGLPSSRGWRVREGAVDSIAAAQLLDRRCRFPVVVAWGVSMGGNASGLAVAAKAKRTAGKPLFDWWLDVEGATNVVETYFEASGVARSGNSYAVAAQQDIEQEMGGTYTEQQETYQRSAVVTRGADIKASGLKGVLMVHAVDDGLVPYNQTREMAVALRAAAVPADVFTVTTRTDTEPGTTLDGYVTGNIPGFTSPFAGHGSEVNEKHIVIRAGFQLLTQLLAGHRKPTCKDHVIVGSLGAASTWFESAPSTC